MTDFEKWKILALFQNLQVTQQYIKNGINNSCLNQLFREPVHVDIWYLASFYKTTDVRQKKKHTYRQRKKPFKYLTLISYPNSG